MARGLPINRKSFYGSSEAGRSHEIEMPPLPQEPVEVPVIEQVAAPQQPIQQASPHEQEEIVNDSEQEQPETQQEEIVALREYLAPIREKVAASNKTKEENFRDIRLAKERAERERDAMMSQMIEMQMRMQQQVQKPIEPVVEPMDFNIDPEDLASGKHLMVLKQQSQKQAKELADLKFQMQQDAVRNRLRSEHKDYETVVSTENIKILEEQYPDIHATLDKNPDLYGMGTAAYKIMKQFGIHKVAQKEAIYEEDRVRTIANAAKPRPLASVSPQQGDSPLSKANAFANGLTEELREQLRKEMNSSRRNF